MFSLVSRPTGKPLLKPTCGAQPSTSGRGVKVRPVLLRVNSAGSLGLVPFGRVAPLRDEVVLDAVDAHPVPVAALRHRLDVGDVRRSEVLCQFDHHAAVVEVHIERACRIEVAPIAGLGAVEQFLHRAVAVVRGGLGHGLGGEGTGEQGGGERGGFRCDAWGHAGTLLVVGRRFCPGSTASDHPSAPATATAVGMTSGTFAMCKFAIA